MAQDKLIVHDAREHNLKNITVAMPRDRLVVITGISGSGKSSLAFDTIYAEGQRRYVESLSSYARQFLGLMEKPDVEYIEGLSPAISIDQKGTSRNPRSTVGTVTEIYDYLRLLYARVGHPHCPQCGREISQQGVQQIVDSVLQLPDDSRLLVLAPLVRDRKGEHRHVLNEVRKAGFVRVRVDGVIRDVDEEIQLDRYKQHTIEAVVDRLVVRQDEQDRQRFADSVETALKLGDGIVLISHTPPGSDTPQESLYSEHFACVHCGISIGELEPRTFSFNTPYGACPACTGLGNTMRVDPNLVVPNPDLSLAQGAIAPWSHAMDSDGYYIQLLRGVAKHYGIPMNAPAREWTPEQRQVLLYGSGGQAVAIDYRTRHGTTRTYDTTYEGVITNLERRYKETDSDYIRGRIEQYMTVTPCPACGGKRLKPEALAVTVAGANIVEVASQSVKDALRWVETLQGNGAGPSPFNRREQIIAEQILKELGARHRFLVDVGLDYLTLDRAANTLSGGEAQRIRLATQIGSGLMGVLYILDEPSVGLHQRDNRRLFRTLTRLRDLGNTVLIVEHDEETIRSADYIVDLGPGAGEYGGEVVVAGTLDDVLACPDSVTGAFLRGDRRIPVPARRRQGNGKVVIVRGARQHNLKDIDVRLPLGRFVCLTGVSGSGKSTLLVEVLYKRLAQVLYRAKARPGDHDAIEGLEHLDKVVNIDQSPIGRTPRSNPATYTGVFTAIREIFAAVPESRARGYKPGRFSFNIKGGRCEACQGQGILRIEMQFLSDVYVPCEVCKGQRYNREALEIRYKGKNIAEVLEMTVSEALEFYENVPKIVRKLKTLRDVGLGYIRLGQPATTLSGGEAQRVKLSKELSRRATGKTLYILDEPTTGLHFADVEKLLEVLKRLVERGNTVVVIEHNLDVIKSADWIVDLGPEGGDAGGYVIAEGTPEEVAALDHSFTGQFLRRVLTSN